MRDMDFNHEFSDAEFYEFYRKKLDILDWTLKTLEPLNAILSQVESAYGPIKRVFNHLYALHRDLLSTHDLIEKEKILPNFTDKNTKIEWSKSITQLAWGKLPKILNVDKEWTALESHIQTLVLLSHWIKIENVLRNTENLLISYPKGERQQEKMSQCLDEINVLTKNIIKVTFEHHRMLQDDQLSETYVERFRESLLELMNFLKYLNETLQFMAMVAPLYLNSLNIVDSIYRHKENLISKINEFLAQEYIHLPIILSYIEVSRRIDQKKDAFNKLKEKVRFFQNEISYLLQMIHVAKITIQKSQFSNLLEELSKEMQSF